MTINQHNSDDHTEDTGSTSQKDDDWEERLTPADCDKTGQSPIASEERVDDAEPSTTVDKGHIPGNKTALLEGEEGEKQPSGISSDHSKLKIPDGGYGWFVVLGCFIAHMVFGGLDRSEGVYFLLFTERFGEGAQITAWPGAMVSTLQLVLGPLANALSTRYSVRSTVLVGGTLMTVGVFLNGFVPSLPLLFLSHAVIGGIGRGLAYAPGLVIIAMYFDKRAGIAAGLGTSGVGIGTFFIVPFSQYLSDTYGFQGTFIILSGFVMHVLLSAMLYRPLCMHRRFAKINDGNSSKDKVYATRQDNFKSGLAVEYDNGSPAKDAADSYLLPEGLGTFCQEPNARAVVSPSKRRKENCCVSSLQIILPVEHSEKSSRSLRQLFQFHLLKNPAFLMYCFSISLFAMSFRAAFTFIPALVQSRGISKSQAAVALSVAGAVDTFGRISSGLFLDHPRIRPVRLLLYNGILFGLAGVAFVLPLLSDIESFCVLCGLYGFLSGAYISQKSVVLADIFEAEDFASSFGILILFQGLGTLLGPPLSGAMKDYFGNFDEAFYLGGGLIVLSGLVMVLCNILNSVAKKRKRAGVVVMDV